jgi:hypothetical protein
MPALYDLRDTVKSRVDGNADSRSLLPRQPFDVDVPTVFDKLTRQHVPLRRDVVQGIIPTYYDYSGPAPGTVVGIVMGSLAGWILLVWLLYSLAQGNFKGGGATIAGEEEVVVRRRRNSHGGRSRRSTPRTEVREFSRSPRRSGREHVIVEERRQPTRTRSIVVEERSRVPGDDVVEVIEEHEEDYRRRSGRNSRGYR